MSKIIWHYAYIGGDEIQITDDIMINPDKMNRWQIIGSLMVSTNLMPNYKWIGDQVSVPFCHIQQRGCKGSTLLDTGPKFGCRVSSIYDANIGFGTRLHSGETPNEVMTKVQESLDFIKLVLNNS